MLITARNRLLTAVASVALVAGLCPVVAFAETSLADPAETADVAAQDVAISNGEVVQGQDGALVASASPDGDDIAPTLVDPEDPPAASVAADDGQAGEPVAVTASTSVPAIADMPDDSSADGDRAATTMAFGSLEIADGALTVYPWTGSSVEPNVVVKDAEGNVLTEGVDYQLRYRSTARSSEMVDSVSDEGDYSVSAKGIGSYSSGIIFSAVGAYGDQFSIAKPEHDLTQATVTGPATYTYADGGSMEDVLTPVVTLGGVQLSPETDYYLFYSKAGWDGSGELGSHTVQVYGKTTDGVKTYYGSCEYSYEVVSEQPDEPTATRTRVDEATGVTATGDVIAEKSSDGNQVKLTVTKPTGDDVEAAAADAKAAAEKAGALTADVYDVTLDVLDADGEVAEHLTSGFSLALTFPVDPKYNGYTATITQVHDGVALASKTATVANGAVSTDVDCLSQFVVSVNPKPAQEGGGAIAAPKGGSRQGDSKSGKMPATGDPLPVPGLCALAALAGLALIAGKKVAVR